MKMGAERKKQIVLGALLLAAAVVYFVNSSSTGGREESGRTTAASRVSGSLPPASPGAPRDNTPAKQARGRTSSEFRPSLKAKRGEDRPDPSNIDPTLRLDLLAKLQTVDIEGSHRSIFDFGQAPAPKVDPVKAADAKPPVPSPIVPVKPAETASAAVAAQPKAPPIPLKFYGYVNPAGQTMKRAFFMDGDEIHVVTEGEMVKRRYKIVRIGINSVVVEDTQFKSQQTLPLEEQQG